MTRLLILAALAAGALLAWLNVRDLIGDWLTARRALERYGDMDWSRFDPMDDVQPSDPWPVPRYLADATSCLAPSCGRVVGDAFWCDEHKPRLSGPVERKLAMKLIADHNLAPAWSPDMPYLEAVPLAHMRRAFQSGPLGPTA